MLQFNEEEIDTDLLIAEVKRRPQLYTKHYHNMELKVKLWEDIAEIMFLNIWDDLSQKQKYEAGDIVRRRWKSLTDCFRRELRKQNGGNNEWRKKYVFYNKLLFLLPMFSKGKTKDSTHDDAEDTDDPPSETLSQYVVKEETHFETCGIDDNTNDFALEEVEEIAPQASSTRSNAETFENFSEEKTQLDAETHFLLSLAPRLGCLNEDKKFDVQIQFLQILKHATNMQQAKKKH